MREGVKTRHWQPLIVRALPLLLGIILLPSAVSAQSALNGTVKDSSGAVIPGVTVEAASPVLIEKVRTTVTDGNGRYALENLRPGTYSVTFTLPGFNTVKRDDVILSGSATVAIDATLRVGAVAETITVTGETPIVDIASTTKQAVLDTTTVTALPTSRNYVTLARLVPGTTGGTDDVGGSTIAEVGGSVMIHGSKSVDQRITLNGVNIMTLQAGGNIGGQQPDVGSAAEITIDTSSLSADMSTGGVRINFIPKDGGNSFTNSTFVTFSTQSMQGDNFTQELKDAGLATPNKIDKNFDINESLGGPVKRDKLWFYFSTRYNRANTFGGIFNNKNAYDPTQFLYVPDTTQGLNKGWVQQNNLRMTWQVSPKNKIAGTYKVDHFCSCPRQISATTSPEAASDFRFPRLRQEHLEYTGTLTNKLLLEAVGMHLFERWGNMDPRVSHDSVANLADEAQIPNMISVRDSANGLTYRVRNMFNNTFVPNYTYRVAASYVTGTHAFKAGWNDTFGFLNMTTYGFQPFQYAFNKGTPTGITTYAVPYTALSDQNHDFGVFAQDSWKLTKLTLNGALRFDYFKTSFPQQVLGPSLIDPNRNIVFAASDGLSWKDLTYRSGFAYDVRGDGKTAIKVALNKYLLGQTLNGLGSAQNPSNAFVNNTTRSWTDGNHNFIPDCDLASGASQDFTASGGDLCGPWTNQAFNTAGGLSQYSTDLTTGFGHRPFNWEFSAGVQHEILPRLSVEVSYFRRIWGNFSVTDNLAAAPSDYPVFDLVAPVDPRLPNGGGYTLTGFHDTNASTIKTNNLTGLSTAYGTQTEHWNGVDITLNGRLQNGLSFQAGLSTGRDSTNNCEIIAKVPEALVGGNPSSTLPSQFCATQEPMQTQFKGYGSYTIPKVDVQIAATFRSVPGVSNGANATGNTASGLAAIFTADNAFLATNSTLGQPLNNKARNIALQIIDPNSKYLDRNNQLDIRFAKVFRYARTRSTVSLDLYNALNSNVVTTASSAFATWLTPQAIVNARLMKVSATFELR